MQNHFLSCRLAIAVVVAAATTIHAEPTNIAVAVQSPAAAEAAYTQTIEKRVADILAVLNLPEPTKHKNVHDLLVAQYRALNEWHNANDAKRKAAKGEKVEQLKSSLKAIHEKFIPSLSAELSPEQVEQVKDKMTYGKVQFTFAGYLAAYPDLKDEHKSKVLELLKQAREEAIDGGSSDEKSAIFNRYKGKINNYLSSQGVSDPKKKKAAPATTNSPAAH